MRDNLSGGQPSSEGERAVRTAEANGLTSGATRSERIHEILDDLIRQRQSLRVPDNGGDTGLLEANRRSIVYWQTELSRALLAERPEAASTRYKT